jgi:hypothetical protein
VYSKIPINTTDDDSPIIAEVQLEQQSFQLYFRFNSRAGFWRCDVRNTQGVALAAGLAVRNSGIAWNQALYLHDGLPQGLLRAAATATPATDAGANELGGRVGLYYRTAIG